MGRIADADLSRAPRGERALPGGGALRAFELHRLRDVQLVGGPAEVLVLGAAYREDVGDTRYSGSEMVVRKLTEMGAEMRVHDPYVAPSAGAAWRAARRTR